MGNRNSTSAGVGHRASLCTFKRRATPVAAEPQHSEVGVVKVLGEDSLGTERCGKALEASEPHAEDQVELLEAPSGAPCEVAKAWAPGTEDRSLTPEPTEAATSESGNAPGLADAVQDAVDERCSDRADFAELPTSTTAGWEHHDKPASVRCPAMSEEAVALAQPRALAATVEFDKQSLGAEVLAAGPDLPPAAPEPPHSVESVEPILVESEKASSAESDVLPEAPEPPRCATSAEPATVAIEKEGYAASDRALLADAALAAAAASRQAKREAVAAAAERRAAEAERERPETGSVAAVAARFESGSFAPVSAVPVHREPPQEGPSVAAVAMSFERGGSFAPGAGPVPSWRQAARRAAEKRAEAARQASQAPAVDPTGSFAEPTSVGFSDSNTSMAPSCPAVPNIMTGEAASLASGLQSVCSNVEQAETEPHKHCQEVFLSAVVDAKPAEPAVDDVVLVAVETAAPLLETCCAANEVATLEENVNSESTIAELREAEKEDHSAQSQVPPSERNESLGTRVYELFCSKDGADGVADRAPATALVHPEMVATEACQPLQPQEVGLPAQGQLAEHDLSHRRTLELDEALEAVLSATAEFRRCDIQFCQEGEPQDDQPKDLASVAGSMASNQYFGLDVVSESDHVSVVHASSLDAIDMDVVQWVDDMQCSKDTESREVPVDDMASVAESMTSAQFFGLDVVSESDHASVVHASSLDAIDMDVVHWIDEDCTSTSEVMEECDAANTVLVPESELSDIVNADEAMATIASKIRALPLEQMRFKLEEAADPSELAALETVNATCQAALAEAELFLATHSEAPAKETSLDAEATALVEAVLIDAEQLCQAD